jgi:hypothetical protein
VYAFLKRTLADPFPVVHHYQVNKPALYETYAQTCREVVATTDFKPIYQLLLEQFKVLLGFQNSG